MNKLGFLKKFFGKLTTSGTVYSSIKNTFRYHIRRRFLDQQKYLLVYEDKVVIIAVFLLISSSFMFRTKREKYFDFDWESSLSVFKPEHMRGFLICSIRYLLDAGIIVENKPEIMSYISGLKNKFDEQYMHFFEVQFKKKKNLNENIDMKKYVQLLDYVLKIHTIYQEEIPKDSSKVVDLVQYTTELKERTLSLFKNKAEYIMFSFFVNLKT